MKATLSELAKIAVEGGTVFNPFFAGKVRGDYEKKISFMEAFGAWAEKFFGRTFDRTALEESKALLAQAVF